MKVFAVCLIGLVSTVIVGCAAVRDQGSSELGVSSAVAVTNPNYKPASNEPLSWYKEVIWVGEFNEVPQGFDKSFIRESIDKNLKTKGYRVVDSSTNYMVAAVMLQGAVADHPDLQALVKLFPDLSGSFRGRERGTLILAILPRIEQPQDGLKSLWRGAIQLLIAKEGELPVEVRKQRVEMAIARLMASVPKAE